MLMGNGGFLMLFGVFVATWQWLKAVWVQFDQSFWKTTFTSATTTLMYAEGQNFNAFTLLLELLFFLVLRC